MDVVLEHLGDFAVGLRATLLLSVLSFLVALAIAFVVATFRVSPVAPLRAAGLAYVEVFRNMPLPVFFALAVFGLPKAGLTLSFYAFAVMVLAMYTGAFLSEALRSVVQPIGSLFIALVKNSAIASAFAVVELTAVFDELTEREAQTLPLLVGTAVAYLLITIPAGLLTGVVERRVAMKR